MRVTMRNVLRYVVGGNFFLFIGVVGWFGGDPMQGRLVDGRYYLGYHHRYVEVTQGIFLGMSVYMSLTFVSMIVAVVIFASTNGE